DQRIEEVEQDHQDVVVEVQLAVAGLVAAAAVVVKKRKQPGHSAELLEPAELIERDLGPRRLCHVSIMPDGSRSRKRDKAPHCATKRRTAERAQTACRTGLATSPFHAPPASTWCDTETACAG